MESGLPQQEEFAGREKRPAPLPAVLYAVLISSLAGLLISIFRWKLVAIVTVFTEPLIEIAIFGVFFAVFLWALVFAFVPLRGLTRRRVAPFMLALAALLIFMFVPFTELELKADFYFNLSKRTAVAERIVRNSAMAVSKAGESGDHVDLYGLSEDGEGYYWHNEQKQMVLFLTFRGILGHFSGFVYSATDAAPEEGDFGCRLVEIEHFQPRWYWIACR